MIFHPSLDYGIADGYYDLVDGLVGDIYKQASLIPRLAAHTGVTHYQEDLEEMDDLCDMRTELMERVTGMSACHPSPLLTLEPHSFPCDSFTVT